jgi:hypothetical protein
MCTETTAVVQRMETEMPADEETEKNFTSKPTNSQRPAK